MLIGRKKISFKLVKVDEDRKVMIIKNKYLDKYFSSSYEMDYELMLKNYYSNHEIIPYSSDAIVKDNRNIGVINEINGNFVVSMYRHNVSIGIYSLKEIDKLNVSWEYNGSSGDNGIEYFDSYEQDQKIYFKLLALNIYYSNDILKVVTNFCLLFIKIISLPPSVSI